MPRNDPKAIAQVLEDTKTIALVGASKHDWRDSNQVMKFLIDQGYTVYPVNPMLEGQTIHGMQVYASLGDIPFAIDMVDVFRNSEAAGEVCREAVEIGARSLWLQLGVINEGGARLAEAAGLTVIMDRCPVIELSHG
ncbi:MAG: CoA-binding protein [Alphaproteobacteria bacterium]|nr:MAG: CoA-binding protein [Alphaproteobacteria bacterium]